MVKKKKGGGGLIYFPSTYMSILCVCMYVYHRHAVPKEARRGCQILQLYIALGCHVGCWKLNLDLLPEQPVHLTFEPFPPDPKKGFIVNLHAHHSSPPSCARSPPNTTNSRFLFFTPVSDAASPQVCTPSSRALALPALPKNSILFWSSSHFQLFSFLSF